MKKNLNGGFRAALTAVLAATLAIAAASASRAQEAKPKNDPAAPPASAAEGWVYRPAPERQVQPTLAQQKAQMRGAQRMARLDAMRWYGYSNSRPTASALAWTTMYSPAWQMPGGRPFAYYTTSRPVVIITPPAPVYR